MIAVLSSVVLLYPISAIILAPIAPLGLWGAGSVFLYTYRPSGARTYVSLIFLYTYRATGGTFGIKRVEMQDKRTIRILLIWY